MGPVQLTQNRDRTQPPWEQGVTTSLTALEQYVTFGHKNSTAIR